MRDVWMIVNLRGPDELRAVLVAMLENGPQDIHDTEVHWRVVRRLAASLGVCETCGEQECSCVCAGCGTWPCRCTADPATYQDWAGRARCITEDTDHKDTEPGEVPGDPEDAD